jgi:hypothetical protein
LLDPAKYVHTLKYTLRRTIDHRHEMKKKFLDTYKDSVNAESALFYFGGIGEQQAQDAG